MAHYAKIVKGKVVQVIVAEPEFIASFVDSSAGKWLKTSYNTRGGVHYGEDGNPDGGEALRKNFAGVGYSYDRIKDAFIPPQPYPSWTLNEETCLWEAPTPCPIDSNEYGWDEETGSWFVAIEG